MILAVIGLILNPISAPAKEKVVKLVLASWEPPNSPSTITFEQFAKDLKAAFPGRLEISLQFGGTLGKPTEYYDIARNGTADISFLATAYTPGRFPVMDLLVLPVKSTSSKCMTSAILHLRDKGFLDKEFAATKLLWLAGTPPYLFQSAPNKAIKTLNDIKGLKIRAAGQMGKAAEALGAIPVGMPMTDVYTSLQRGVIDATMNSPDTIAIFKLNEVIESVTEYNMSALPMAVAMNKDSFEKLPADMKAFIEKTKMKYSEALSAYMDGRAAKGWEIVKKEGKKVYRFTDDEIDKMLQLFVPVWADYIKEFEGKGFPVKAASDELGSYLTSKFGIKKPIPR